MKFEITFKDIFERVENEEQAYDILLDYLKECVENGDVTAFEFKEVK
jgi:hypothetical protein